MDSEIKVINIEEALRDEGKLPRESGKVVYLGVMLVDNEYRRSHVSLRLSLFALKVWMLKGY